MGNLNIALKVINIIVIFIITGNIFADNTLKFNLATGYDSNYEKLNNEKDSFYSGLYLTNIYDFNNIDISLYTDVIYKNYTKSVFSFTQEISFNYGKFSTIGGFNYFRDINDEQNSLYGIYFQQILKFFNGELSYTGFYKNYLKNYTYGSYKSIKNLENKSIKKIISNKKEHDFWQELCFSYSLANNLEPKVGFIINNSNIKKEEYNSFFGELTYNKYLKNINYTINLKIEKLDYFHTSRKDLIFSSDFYIEYYFYNNWFIGYDFQYSRDDSNCSKESFTKFLFEFSIGILF